MERRRLARSGPLALALLTLAAWSRAQFRPVLPGARIPSTAGPVAPGPIGSELLDWQLSPEALDGMLEPALEELEGALAAIEARPASRRTFDNTLVAMELALERFDEKLAVAPILQSVSTDPKVRAAADKLVTATKEARDKATERPELGNAVRAVLRNHRALKPWERALASVLKQEFDKSSPRSKARQLAAERRLDALSAAYYRNLAEANAAVTATPEELEGLPSPVLDRLERTEDGKVRVTLDYPTYEPAMRHVKSAAIRKKLYIAFEGRAAKANLPILKQVTEAHRERARASSTRSWAHYSIASRMAGTPQKVRRFLEKVRRGVAPAFQRSMAGLLELKRADQPKARKLEMWDIPYYQARKRQQAGLDDAMLSEYFPLETVLKNAFEMYGELLGVRFEQRKDAPTWHPDARLFDIVDDATGARLGSFYADLFPREGKYTHMAVFDIVNGRLTSRGYVQPVSALIGNFTPPSPGSPSLLSHDEVRTLMHELGHVMHETLTTARRSRISGFRVADDLSETPSTAMENLVWKPETLMRLSGHKDDPSRKLPRAVARRLAERRAEEDAIDLTRTAARAMLDLTLNGPMPVSLDRAARAAWRAFGLPAVPKSVRIEATFQHLIDDDYAAGYYGYVWSAMLAAEFFAMLDEEGLGREAGLRYRRAILEPGAERSPKGLVRSYLRRGPNLKALLRTVGASGR